MKHCGGDYGAILELYLDKELSGPDREEFRAHLEECEACRAKLEAGEELSRLLHRSRPLFRAPDALRDRVMRTMELVPPSNLNTPHPPYKRYLEGFSGSIRIRQ